MILLDSTVVLINLLEGEPIMVQITNTTQISVFSLVRSAIVANGTLSTKFNSSNIYKFEPKHKNPTFTGFPYIWVNYPTTETEHVVMDHNFTLKEFTADLFLRMDWHARDKYESYANAIIAAIEAYEDTFAASGYYNVRIELVDTDANQVLDQKELVEGIFEITWDGQVGR